jgi:hypothetical protein
MMAQELAAIQTDGHDAKVSSISIAIPYASGVLPAAITSLR